MDIRLRIMRRILEIGYCDKYYFDFDTTVNRDYNMPITRITVFTGKGKELAIADVYRKNDTDDEKAVFEWLDMWKERIEEARKLEAYRH